MASAAFAAAADSSLSFFRLRTPVVVVVVVVVAKVPLSLSLSAGVGRMGGGGGYSSPLLPMHQKGEIAEASEDEMNLLAFLSAHCRRLLFLFLPSFLSCLSI
jgi:hypothetical protein